MEEAFAHLKSLKCSREGHDLQPILRICLDERCCGRFGEYAMVCGDCVIDHSDHYHRCIKLEAFQKVVQAKASISNRERQDTAVTVQAKDIHAMIDQSLLLIEKVQRQFMQNLSQIYKDRIQEIIRSFSQYVLFSNTTRTTELAHSSGIPVWHLVHIYEMPDWDFRENNRLAQEAMASSQELIQESLDALVVGFSKSCQSLIDGINVEIRPKLQGMLQTSQNDSISAKGSKDWLNDMRNEQAVLKRAIIEAESDKDKALKLYKETQASTYELEEQEKAIFYRLQSRRINEIDLSNQFTHRMNNLTDIHTDLLVAAGAAATNTVGGGGINQQQQLQQQQQQQKRQQQQTLNRSKEDIRTNSLQESQMELPLNQLSPENSQKVKHIRRTKDVLATSQQTLMNPMQKETEELQKLLDIVISQKEKLGYELKEKEKVYQNALLKLKEYQAVERENEEKIFHQKKKLLNISRVSPIKKHVFS